MKVLLLSTYDLGHQPFGLASPAAWLQEAGAQVTCNDLAVEPLNEGAVRGAALIAIHVPMHTATRLASALIPKLRALNAGAHVCVFGLYAPLNADHLTSLGARSVLGGEFEEALVALYRRLGANGWGAHDPMTRVSHAKQRFRVPDRSGLPPLDAYAYLTLASGETLTAGYTEASRGCKHLCRHCPVVPVYDGRFFIVQPAVVLADIRRQVAAGARHVTFGDPDFFNGPGHAIAIVEALARQFPGLTYDVTIKVEHLLRHAHLLARLKDTGCLFVTTAVESVDDDVLRILEKGHTRADFLRLVGLARDAGLLLSPTFIPFTPWTTAEGYVDLLDVIAEEGLVEQVAPIQLAIRLLVPRGSRLLEVEEMTRHLGAYDDRLLGFPWAHPDRRLDELHATVSAIVEEGERAGARRAAIFARMRAAAHDILGLAAPPVPRPAGARSPRMSEAWYCCAEPTARQLAQV